MMRKGTLKDTNKTSWKKNILSSTNRIDKYKNKMTRFDLFAIEKQKNKKKVLDF
jgi:hypothetical protein